MGELNFQPCITSKQFTSGHGSEGKDKIIYTFANNKRVKVHRIDKYHFRVCLTSGSNSNYFPFGVLINTEGNNTLKAWMIPFVDCVAKNLNGLGKSNWRKNLIALTAETLYSASNQSKIFKLIDLPKILEKLNESVMTGYTIFTGVKKVGHEDEDYTYGFVTEAKMTNEVKSIVSTEFAKISDNGEDFMILFLRDYIYVTDNLWDSLEFECLDENSEWESLFYQTMSQVLQETGNLGLTKFYGLKATMNRLIVKNLAHMQNKGGLDNVQENQCRG